MFTGIIEELGHIAGITPDGDVIRLSVRCTDVVNDAAEGDSIAVNGVCLTVAQLNGNGFSADVMPETLRRSSLGSLEPGDTVNLERALAVTGRLGGHIVQGHVDATGELLSRTPGERWEVVRISLPAQIARYVVEKGSIAVDGTSLTVSAVGEDYFEVSLIPTTLDGTILGRLTPGAIVNLEVDVLAKYVEKLIRCEEPKQ
ncbi:riboflavin synthase [Corynebacterium sp. CCM 9185]|uniref:Riboflavin synthase n=1 Tax=Corynebacterium marambiense TaxID=2765364 RepID=A0ABS0VXB2_9CORY|nr:riboflavin synthase [Corynebacterium marambiense]MBI9001424.1 riboflavin synthase [Corynebacterium marambiense]MCK7664051.1 riboflavin synthase [Corynebacterium marambiense]MCX7543387.1 riboflavin synthase [Corynebacterium marambiense]